MSIKPAPEVTVIIAAKDSEKWISKTVQSLMQQDFENWECIFSINGSSDTTLEIARSFCKNDDRFIELTSNIANKSLAVNRAIIQSRADLIAILDSDDLWHPNKLTNQTHFLQCNSDVDILGTQILYIDENDAAIPSAPLLPLSNDDCVKWLLSENNPIANSSVLYRKSIHDKVGFYDPEKFAVEDYDMWMRAKRAGLIFANTEKFHLMHRLHKHSSYNSANKQGLYKRLVDDIDKAFKILGSL